MWTFSLGPLSLILRCLLVPCTRHSPSRVGPILGPVLRTKLRPNSSQPAYWQSNVLQPLGKARRSGADSASLLRSRLSPLVAAMVCICQHRQLRVSLEQSSTHRCKSRFLLYFCPLTAPTELTSDCNLSKSIAPSEHPLLNSDFKAWALFWYMLRCGIRWQQMITLVGLRSSWISRVSSRQLHRPLPTHSSQMRTPHFTFQPGFWGFNRSLQSPNMYSLFSCSTLRRIETVLDLPLRCLRHSARHWIVESLGCVVTQCCIHAQPPSHSETGASTPKLCLWFLYWFSQKPKSEVFSPPTQSWP